MPFNRMERPEGQPGIPLPATTQWELMAAFAKLLRPLLEELIRQAAQGSVMLELAEADGNRTSAGQLPHAREAAVYGDRGEFSRRTVRVNIFETPESIIY